jgi:hypothetical protein
LYLVQIPSCYGFAKLAEAELRTIPGATVKLTVQDGNPELMFR